MAAIVQLGTALKIGYGSFAYTGYVAQGVTTTTTGEIKTLKNADNATFCKLVEDLGTQHQIDLLILDATGSITPPAKGSTVTLTPPQGASTPYMVQDSSVKFSAEEAMLSLTLIKEVSMTYS